MKFSVTKYGLNPLAAEGGTKGSYGMETLSFSFSPEWEALAKSITFYPPHNAPICVYLKEDEIPLPSEVTARAGKTLFVICGTSEDRTILTVTGTIEVKDTLNPTEQEAGDYTPSAIAFITEACSKAEASAEQARLAAEEILSRGAVLTIQCTEHLPQTGQTDILYVVPAGRPGEQNEMDEYIYICKSPSLYGWQLLAGSDVPAVVYTLSEEPAAGDAVYSSAEAVVDALSAVQCEAGVLTVRNIETEADCTYQRSEAADCPAEYDWEKISTTEDLSAYERLEHKTNSITAESTADEYPSAKAAYDALEEKASLQMLSSGLNTKVSRWVVNEALNGSAGEVIIADGQGNLINSGTDIAVLNGYEQAKLDKPLTEGASGQYLTSNGTGGSVWKTFDYSYSKTESDARYAEKGAVGEGENKLQLITGLTLPECPEANKLYMTGAPGAAVGSNYYDKQVYVEKPKALNDSYMQWSVIDYGSAGAGPAMIVTASLDVKAGDEVYGVSSGDLSVGYEIAYWTTVSSYEQGVITCDNGATLGSGTITALKVTNHDSFTGRSYEQIGEKPWVTLLDYTAAQSYTDRHLYVNTDIAGKGFSISEIELCFYIYCTGGAGGAFANSFNFIPNANSTSASENCLFIYPYTGFSSSYGSLRMNKTLLNDGWRGYAESYTSMVSNGESGSFYALHSFTDIGSITSFSINGLKTGSANDFGAGTRFVVRGR